jgi:phosphoribosyl-ATP pyrophosphohydrolase
MSDGDAAPGSGDDRDADAHDASTDSGPDDAAAVLEELFAVIESRKANLPEGSYTTRLFTHEKGENYVLEKLGEEATEILLAAKDDDADELAAESADFVYHLLVLLSMKGMDPEDLLAELRARR